MRDLWIAAALVGLGPSCGFITAGAASAASDESSASDAPAAITGFAVEGAKTEPARIRFVLADAEGDAVEVEIRYEADPDGTGPQPAVLGKVQHLFEPRPPPPANPQRASAPLSNPLVLAASPQGTEHVFDWYFTREAGIEDATFNEHVFVYAQVTGGAQSLTPGANAALLGVGNDPPVIVADQDGFADAEIPSAEVVGLARVTFLVADSSLDQVDVDVEYALADGLDVDAGELPDASSFQPATPDGQPPEAIQTTEGGTSVDFFWNPVADLGRTEHDVVFRITPSDRDEQGDVVATGVPVLTRRFRIDNNAAPIVQLQNDAVIANSDERRGIPIPFRVIDEEEDLVEVIFQWRREGEAFPSLLSDMAALDAILADPAQRRAHRICTPYPRYAQGRVSPIDATSVRLPELAASESWILASGLEGKSLELLRPSSIPAPLTPTWSSNPLVSPVAALALGDGLTALVLDAPGSARLREIELATGAVVREIAIFGPGFPSAMALERGGEEAVLVALDDAGVWRLARVELASGAVSELAVSDGAEPAPVRGIASLGTHAAVFTAGSSLFFCDWQEPLAPRLGPLSTGFAAPWGVVIDPLATGRLYVSERDANRVLAVDLDSHGKLPVVVHSAPLQLGTFDSPEALCLERHGSRLLVVTGTSDGQRKIEGLDLGAADGNVSFPIGVPMAEDITGLASGPDGLRLACVPAANELLAGGGVEQRRTIVAYESFDAGAQAGQRATLEAVLQPEARPGQSWRVPDESWRIRGSAGGRAASFVWSSGIDVPTAGLVLLRALARDEELGPTAEGAALKNLRAGLDVEPLVRGGPSITTIPLSVAAADLDGDGDLDLVSVNLGDNLTVFFQTSPGVFALGPVLGGPSVTNGPQSVATADLDGDGDVDLVSGNAGGHNLTVFFQTSPGIFALGPVLGGPSITDSPGSVAAADLDGDGDIDLVSTNRIFFQTSPGSFTLDPEVLDGGGGYVAAADLDGDGDIDIVDVNTFGHNLTAFFQTSPGNFALGPMLGGPSITDFPQSVAAADLDGDGDIDLVSTNRIFFQTSPGSFTLDPEVLDGGGGYVTAADLDGDGDIDIVDVNTFDRNLTVFFQTSPGSFAPQPLVLGGPSITDLPLSVAAADLDGDGDIDLVSANEDSSNLTAFFQSSPGSFASQPLVLGDPSTGPSITDFPLSVAAADLDGDGDLDLVSANENSRDLTVFFQSSPGSFASVPLVLGGPSITDRPQSVAAADLDGDGDLDLVSANLFHNLTVFFQTSPGSFASVPQVLGGFPITVQPRSVAAADIDGDGAIDIVSANSGNSPDSSNLTVFFQDAPGSFDPMPLTLGGPSITVAPVSVAAADFDGDGDIDIVSANNSSSNLTVFFQDAPGSFDPMPLTLGGPSITLRPIFVAAADLDGDGDLDLVSANLAIGSSNLTVFFQTSPGSFAAQPLVLGGFSITGAPTCVAVADLDGDDDLDLVSANRGFSGDDHSLTVFFQTSPGSFASQPQVIGAPSITGSPFSVAAADLDGDGDPDLVSANSAFFTGGKDTLTVFFGGR